jgi:hypothetical protein
MEKRGGGIERDINRTTLTSPTISYVFLCYFNRLLLFQLTKCGFKKGGDTKNSVARSPFAVSFFDIKQPQSIGAQYGVGLRYVFKRYCVLYRPGAYEEKKLFDRILVATRPLSFQMQRRLGVYW